MGQALINKPIDIKIENPTGTMHDNDYVRVWEAIEKVRADMLPSQVCEEFRCPICGGPAFVFCRETNVGKDYVGGCENHCWDIWE
jgi:hypothetical protein